MNAAFLIVTSACLTGADPVPLLAPAPPLAAAVADKAPAEKPPEKVPVTPAPVPAAPAMVAAPAACASCGCESHGWCESQGFFSRLRSGWGHKSCGACSTCAPTPCTTPAPACSTCDTCAKPSFFSRFRFSRGCGCDTCNTCGGAVVAPVPVKPAEPIKSMPMPESKKLPEGGKEAAAPLVPDLTPATNRTIELGTKSPFDLSRRFEKRVDHAADYSRVTGQLYYVHSDGGLWVLRYAPLGTEDQYGGGVILARDHVMDSYKEGDLVTVRGEILQGRASRYLGAPLYRATSIQLVERGEP